jgi:subtilisin family serine protease
MATPRSHRGRARRSALAFGLVPVLALTLTARADHRLADASALALPAQDAAASIDSRLRGATGEVQVVVQLTDTPLVVANGLEAKQRGARLGREQQRAHARGTAASLDALSERVRGLGGRELARVNKALVAVVAAVNASDLGALAALPNVRSIRPVIDYELALAETVPYIGAAAVQGAGFDGTGVRVAVLDSGVDYTHVKLGGSGLVSDYTACYANNTTVGDCPAYPNAKIVGGHDFVGETWTGGAGSPPLAVDPDPIARALTGGHGTHVADIVGGLPSAPGAGDGGVAPGAQIYGVKVCSAVSTACSGVALLQGMDFALDPDGDGDLSDAVDVVNMSLGSNYGQKEDDLGEASANAVRAGVVVVAAAGNAGDRGYIVSSPSTTPEVISVAQTAVPSATRIPLVINSPANIAGTYSNTATVDWAPIGAGVTGDVAFIGRACPDGSGAGVPAGGDPFLADPAGKIALIDRGVCSISLKVDRAAKAGATGVLLGLVAPGDAVTFSFGGGDTFVPTLVIIQADSNRIKANLAAPVNVTVSPAAGIPLVGSMVSSSARGPSVSYNAIKPDLGAPGASVSAEVGTGSAATAFGGTSGATPMVAGSVALLLQAQPTRTPAEIKSLLMNTASTDVTTNPITQPGVPAPISRIGGGEVRVDRALASTTAAWDAEDLTGSLSFGYQALNHDKTFVRRVVVKNYGSERRTYAIQPSFRFPADAASGAVSISAPASLNVPAGRTGTFTVRVHVVADRLPLWTLNGGSRGGDGFRLQDVEFDGYVRIVDATDDVHVAWQILPHRAAAVRVDGFEEGEDGGEMALGSGTYTLSNLEGAVDGRVEVFSLTGTSPRIRKRLLPGPGDNFAVVDLAAVGVRLVDLSPTAQGLQFAVRTHGVRAHPNYPAEFDIYIDRNRDGTPDAVIFNLENGGFGATGQNVVAAGPLPSGPFTIAFFTDADLNSGNAVLTASLAALGLTAATQFDFSVYAFDNYFTGDLTDAIEGMTYTPATPRFSSAPQVTVPVGGTQALAVSEVAGGETASPSQRGLLLLFRDARPNKEGAALKIRR